MRYESCAIVAVTLVSASRSRSLRRSLSTSVDSTYGSSPQAVGRIGRVADVLIVADTRSSPEMRHEVPLVIPDPFLYAEVDGNPHAATVSFEKGRIEELNLGIEVTALEELELTP